MGMIHYTPSGVRLTEHIRRPGNLNWLFLPGGPGIGSESLTGLVDLLEVPGTSWLVDLPGDGSNVEGPGILDDPFRHWPNVLTEAAGTVANPVFVGHSTGGMYLLATAELEQLLVGLVLISTAPDASWLPAFTTMTEQNPLPQVELTTARYESEPTNENLAAVAVASTPWNFGTTTLETGAKFLATMPYNGAAVAWSEENFDHDYEYAWWPTLIPTLIVSGSEDRIVTQELWNDKRFTGNNIHHARIERGAHFPWFENPAAVKATFEKYSESLARAMLESPY
ncbi:alpha/beta hydrolase [Arthrobacter glacialis]|uniref:Alpha/beta hydrolase n=2 Tax=Arthrobacter glacialis TaxID=1664 RepID=A0A2S3ZUF6_ARTGL|nr:alpha/beta hydrolase [Arthrobacter glacialis]